VVYMVGISGQRALITGAGKRLGRACAVALAEAGMDIILHYNTSEVDVVDTVNEISALGRRAWTVQADLSDPDKAAGLAQNIYDLCGGFNILINNASVFPESTLDDLSYESLINTISVNTWAPFIIGREMKHLSTSGHIVNLLDCRIDSYDWTHVGYHASKVLLELFTREMAIKFAPRISVNAIAPGLILPPEGKDESYMESLKHTVPMDRYGSILDVRDAVLYLVNSTFITGQIIYLDGGRHLFGGRNG
jgi:pteridine reductase